jgi:hypothetical protein
MSHTNSSRRQSPLSIAGALTLLMGLLLVLLPIAPTPASADEADRWFTVSNGNGQEVCAGFDAGTVKTDVVGAFKTLDLDATSGFLIDGYCVKAGSDRSGAGAEWVPVDPPVKSVTISHSSGKDISHYSLRFVPVSTVNPVIAPDASFVTQCTEQGLGWTLTLDNTASQANDGDATATFSVSGEAWNVGGESFLVDPGSSTAISGSVPLDGTLETTTVMYGNETEVFTADPAACEQLTVGPVVVPQVSFSTECVEGGVEWSLTLDNTASQDNDGDASATFGVAGRTFTVAAGETEEITRVIPLDGDALTIPVSFGERSASYTADPADCVDESVDPVVVPQVSFSTECVEGGVEWTLTLDNTASQDNDGDASATFGVAGRTFTVAAGETEEITRVIPLDGDALTIPVSFGERSASYTADPADCVETTDNPSEDPPVVRVPPQTPTPGVVDVAAQSECVADAPSILMDVDFTDNDVPVESVTVTLEGTTGVLASYDFVDDEDGFVAPWPDLDVTSLDVLVGGELLTTLALLDDCSDVLGVVVEPTPEVTPDPTPDTEVLGEEVVNPAPDVDTTELAATGLDSALGLALGSVLMAGGMLLLLADRRRQLVG